MIVPSHEQRTSVITSCNGVEACCVKQSAFFNLGPPTIYMWGRLGPPPASPSLLDSLQGLVACQVEFEESRGAPQHVNHRRHALIGQPISAQVKFLQSCILL